MGISKYQMVCLLNNTKEHWGVSVGCDYSEKCDSFPDLPADIPILASLINFCHVVHWV